MTRLHRIRLDHGGRAPRWLRLPAVVLAASAAACVALASYALQLADAAAMLEQQVERRETAGRVALARHRQAPPSAQALADERLAAQLRAEMTMPWERLFGAIEDATGTDVSLLSMAPASSRSQLNLGGEARNMAALLAFMKRLQESGSYAQVYLREHHTDPADPQQPVRFSLELKWERGT